MAVDCRQHFTSSYTLIDLRSAIMICAGCQQSLTWLAPACDGDPEFDLCFPCRRVWHIGSGEVMQEIPHVR